MNRTIIMLIGVCLSLALFVPVFAVSGTARNNNIVLRKFSGTVRIYTPSQETIILTQRDRKKYIPVGSKIKVVIGTAEIFCYGIQVHLDEGQAVVILKNFETDEMEFIIPNESLGYVNLTAGTRAFLMSKDGGIGVRFNELDEQEIEVLEHGVKLITSLGEEDLEIGSIINADLTAKEKEKEGKPVVPEPLPPRIDEASPSVPN